MEERGWLKAVWGFAKPVLLIDVGILATVGLVCWLGSWWSAAQYGNGLIVAGVGAIAVGLASLLGGWGVTRSFTYQYAQTAGEDRGTGRAQRELEDSDRSYGFLAVMGVAGLVVIACGLILRTILAIPGV